MKRRDMLAVCALLAALPLTACNIGPDPTPAYRYRLTVEVDTPDGLKTGSSVIEVETDVAGSLAITTPGRVSHKLRGEAVTVNLGDGRYLFALLRSVNDIDWAGSVLYRFAPDGSGSGNERFLNQHRNMLRMRKAIELPQYFPDQGQLRDWPARPMLVTFDDLADPTTVIGVNPTDLAATFGEGVSLRRITIQLTADPVTKGIEDRLDWLPSRSSGMLDGNTNRTIKASNRLANELMQLDFSRGILE